MNYIHFFIGIIVGILTMYISTVIKDKCLIKTHTYKDILKILVRQAARWSTAAKQDKSPLVSILHSNYGAGYLWAIKDIANAEQIKIATGVDLSLLEAEIVKTQDDSVKKMIMVCPKFAPEKSYLTLVAKEA